MRLAPALLLLLMGGAAMAAEFTSLCDFETTARLWTSEHGAPTSGIRTVQDAAHSGSRRLAVDMAPSGAVLRAVWGIDAFDVELQADSRFRFWIKGTPAAQARDGQPHGGLIAIEADGKTGGGDSHWLLHLPFELWGSDRWQEFTTPPLAEAANPDWATDADGKLDVSRISRLFFVLQQDDPRGNPQPYTVYLDDFSASHCSPRQPRVVDAVNESVPAAIRPVQRGFIGRKRDAGQTVTFSDVTGWKVVQFGSTDAQFVRSEEEPLFGDAGGKLIYRSGGGPGYVRLEPPVPVELVSFDAVLMWVFGNNWDWVPDPTTPQVLVSLEFKDNSGERHLVALNRVNWKFWSMMHKLVRPDTASDERHVAVGGDFNGRLDYPVRFTAIEVTGGTNTEPRSLYFDSIIFRKEKIELPRYSTNLEDLPFPTTPDTILPSVIGDAPKLTVTERGDSYVFHSASDGRVVEYVYTPRTGTLSDLTARVYGKEPFRPCDGAGPEVDGKTPEVRLTFSKLNPDNSVVTRWESDDGVRYAITMRLKGRSLVCDWSSNGTRITGLTLGAAADLADYSLFNVPYLTMGFGTHPAVLYSNGAYCFTLLDWYNTSASQFYGRTERISDTSGAMNGGARYLPLTDGSRNCLRERQVITVSPSFEEVLPNIPNPPSPLKETLGTYLYTHIGRLELDRFTDSLKTWKLYKEYGIDFLRLAHHEDAWSDADTNGQGPQEFTMTLDAAPEIGDDQLVDYCRQVRELGYLVGLYSNYTDYSMLGKSWDERNVARLSNGEWRRAWPPNFNINPVKAADMEAYYAPRVAEKFGVNTVYCDVHTCIAPWDYVDYTAGLPGAGMLLTQFRAYGALMLNERVAYKGPVFSEGCHHWFYAGLNDGNYAQMSRPDADKVPLLLDFDLRKLHPLQANVAMGPWPAWGESTYHLLATQIAYGHIGYLPQWGIEMTARIYYMMQQLQKRYTMVPVLSILYAADDGALMPVSAALPVGANANNAAKITYENGLTVWANCHREKHWKFEAAGRSWDLSPHSWLAVAPDFVEYSTEIDGRRVNYVNCPIYTYADAGGELREFPELRTSGSLVVRKDDPRGPKLIPIAGANSVFIRQPESAVITAYSADDLPLGEVKPRANGGWLELGFLNGARYYVVAR